MKHAKVRIVQICVELMFCKKQLFQNGTVIK